MLNGIAFTIKMSKMGDRRIEVQNDIKNPAKYIDKVKDSLRDFRALATSNGVAPLFIDIIESRLRELSPDIFAPAVVTSDLIRFEMTDSGSI